MNNTELVGKINSLESKVNELLEKIESLAIKVEWEVKKTASGIELVGGSTTVKKSGAVVGTMLVPAQQPGVMTVAFVVKTPEKTTELVPAEMCRYI